jgi:hypothetical protein
MPKEHQKNGLNPPPVPGRATPRDTVKHETDDPLAQERTLCGWEPEPDYNL